jgi:transcriptional regulator with XRE-family HTH domain
MNDLITPAQIRAGRALLGWSQEQLATAAEVTLSTVRDIESETRLADTGAAAAIRRALRNEGVVW